MHQRCFYVSLSGGDSSRDVGWGSRDVCHGYLHRLPEEIWRATAPSELHDACTWNAIIVLGRYFCFLSPSAGCDERQSSPVSYLQRGGQTWHCVLWGGAAASLLQVLERLPTGWPPDRLGNLLGGEWWRRQKYNDISSDKIRGEKQNQTFARPPAAVVPSVSCRWSPLPVWRGLSAALSPGCSSTGSWWGPSPGAAGLVTSCNWATLSAACRSWWTPSAGGGKWSFWWHLWAFSWHLRFSPVCR